VLSPLGVVPIAFAPRDGLDVARIDQIRRDARLFEQLIDRNPKDPGRLHRHRINATGTEPGDQGVQIGREGLKDADTLGIAIWGHGNDDFFAANIQTSGIGMDTSELI
jgi:hypothetical protein